MLDIFKVADRRMKFIKVYITNSNDELLYLITGSTNAPVAYGICNLQTSVEDATYYVSLQVLESLESQGLTVNRL